MDGQLTFGEWVTARRRALRLTQRDVAAFSAYSVPTIRKVEANERRPSVELARALAQALEIDERHEPLFVMCARGERPVDQLRRLPQPPVPTALTPHVRRSSARGVLVDLDELPRSASFFGRETELAALQEWLLDPDCRIAVVLGIGGQGKTALAASSIRTLVAQGGRGFSAIMWRSLAGEPSVARLARSLLGPDARGRPLLDQETALDRLIERLRRERCLLVLDGAESILRLGSMSTGAAASQPRFEDYEPLLARLASDGHRSVVLLTTRELPQALAPLELTTAGVRAMRLQGVDANTGLRVLQLAGIDPTRQEAALLVERYSGNPLALRLVADAIREVYGGEIAPFLDTGTPLFDDIRTVLEEQFGRLTRAEKAILFELAVANRPIQFVDLARRLAHPPRPAILLEAVRSLHRRSLVQREAHGYALQHLVAELVAEHLVDAITEEIVACRPDLLATHALIRARDDDRTIESAVRRLLVPLRAELQQRLGSSGVISAVATLLDRLRGDPQLADSHAAGNLLNLVLHTTPRLPTNVDCSRLCLANANLRGVDARQLSLAGSDLAGSAFTDAFGFIDGVAFSPDGELLAAGTGDGRILLWHASDQQAVGVLTGHTGFVESVAFSPTGSRLASGGAEGTVRIWSLPTMECERVIQLEGAVYVVAASPDGSSVAVAGKRFGIVTLATHDGTQVATFPSHETRTFGLAWFPSGLLASGGEDRSVRVWDPASGRCLREMHGHADVVMAVAVSPDGGLLASAGRDGLVLVWDGTTGDRLLTLAGHNAAVRTVSFSPDGRRIASAGEDRTLRLWDARNGKMIAVDADHGARVNGIAFSPDGAVIASGSNDATVRLRDGRTGAARRTIHGHVSWVWDAGPSPDGTMVASVSEDGKTTLWDRATGSAIAVNSSTRQRVKGVAFGGQGDVLATAGADSTVRILSTRGTQLTTQVELTGERGFTSVAFSPDTRLLAASSYDRHVHLWETDTWHRRFRLAGHRDWVETAAFRPDGSLLATGSHDGEVIFWDPSTGERIRTFRDHDDVVASLAFSDDGTVLASAGWDGTIRLQDAATGERKRVMSIPGAWIWGIAFAPGGATLASASSDHAVSIWDAGSGALLRRLVGHVGPVQAVRYAADGSVISCGADGTVRVWNVELGQVVSTMRHPEPYEGMEITGASGITAAQRANLLALGAVELERG